MKIVSTVCAALMVFTVPFSAPAIAMPMPQQPAWDAPQAIKVQRSGKHFRYRHGRPYYRGHRGYKTYRHGYRRHGNYWFPPAAFIAGAIVGGAIANQPAPRWGNQDRAHTAWCYSRYRSYREWDNTFQPYNGPRRQCRSPYG